MAISGKCLAISGKCLATSGAHTFSTLTFSALTFSAYTFSALTFSALTFSAARSLMQQVCGMGLIKVFQKLMSDESIAILGCVSYAVANVIEGLAKSDIEIYIGLYAI